MAASAHDAPVQGPRVLLSRPAWALLTFWAALGTCLLVPSPVRDKLRSFAEASGNSAGTTAVPGVPAPPAAPDPVAAVGSAPGSDKAPAGAAARAEEHEPIQDPNGSLAHFHASLRRTRARQPGAITRVLHYGDSLIDLDHITAPLRRRLQQRFGDAGHGFVLAAKPWRWYNHDGIRLAEGKGWQHLRLVGQRGEGWDGRLGLGAAAIQAGGGGAWVQVKTTARLRASRLQVLYLERPGDGRITVKVDGERRGVIQAGGLTRRSGVWSVQLPDAPHSVRLFAAGRVRIFGVVLERQGPGITWENLTQVSARFHQLLSLKARHWQEQLRLRRPDLVVFQFGANDTIDFGGDLTRYGEKIERVMERLREALPGTSCLVIGPLDRLQRDGRGRLRSPGVVRRVSDQQRESALAAGCAFWDGQRAMGGIGSMQRWLDKKLALKDMVHLNTKGSRAFAALLERALLAGLDVKR